MQITDLLSHLQHKKIIPYQKNEYNKIVMTLVVATPWGAMTPAKSVLCGAKMSLFRHKNYVDDCFYNLTTGNDSSMSHFSDLCFLSHFIFYI